MAGTDMPEVSVILVNYNSYADLKRCLGALIQSGDMQRCEVIVVDNASTDDSAEKLRVDFPEVRLVANDNNAGYGNGNNLGRFHAQGEYLAFLNPDTVVTPGWLAPLIKVLEMDPCVGMVTPCLLQLADPEKLNACGHRVHLSGIVQCRGQGETMDRYPQCEPVSAVSGAAFVIRQEVFDKLGGFDEPFFLYIEDTDLSWRAWLAGYRCLYVPESQVYHDYHLSFGQHKMFYYERNRYSLLLKHLRWRTLMALLPALLVAEVISWSFVMLHNRPFWRNKLHAYRWMATNWPAVIRERRRVQALRKIPDRQLLGTTAPSLIFEQVGQHLGTRLGSWLLNPFFAAYRKILLNIMWW